MNHYLISRLIDGPYSNETVTYGNTELRPIKKDLSEEKQALAASKEAFFKMLGFSIISQHGEELMRRISTIVEAETPQDAILIADQQFEEVLDVLEVTEQIIKFELMKPGFIRFLGNGRLQPILPEQPKPKNSIFEIPKRELMPISLAQFILAKTSPGRDTSELADRFLRSCHWARNARRETNAQFKVLFRWFALESIWTEKKDEDIITPLLYAMGFPRGQFDRSVEGKVRKFTNEIKDYKTWGKEIQKRLEAVKDFRHRTAHNGFRLQDIEQYLIKQYQQISHLALNATSRLTQEALMQGIKTKQELLIFSPISFEKSKSIHDIQNILDSLKNPKVYFRAL